LARIGSEMEQMIEWFIRFAAMDLKNASEGDFLMLREDIVALSKGNSLLKDSQEPHFQSTNPGDRRDWPELISILQKTIRMLLNGLADSGMAVMGPTSVVQILVYPRRGAKVRGLPLPDERADLEAHYSIPDFFSYLVYSLGQLLEKVGKLIARCPHCRKIFLQSRRNQEYCGRSCQSVAIMQRLRADAKTSKKSEKRPLARRAKHGAKRG
jgi:hypothetical protein